MKYLVSFKEMDLEDVEHFLYLNRHCSLDWQQLKNLVVGQLHWRCFQQAVSNVFKNVHLWESMKVLGYVSLMRTDYFAAEKLEPSTHNKLNLWELPPMWLNQILDLNEKITCKDPV